MQFANTKIIGKKTTKMHKSTPKSNSLCQQWMSVNLKIDALFFALYFTSLLADDNDNDNELDHQFVCIVMHSLLLLLLLLLQILKTLIQRRNLLRNAQNLLIISGEQRTENKNKNKFSLSLSPSSFLLTAITVIRQWWYEWYDEWWNNHLRVRQATTPPRGFVWLPQAQRQPCSLIRFVPFNLFIYKIIQFFYIIGQILIWIIAPFFQKQNFLTK